MRARAGRSCACGTITNSRGEASKANRCFSTIRQSRRSTLKVAASQAWYEYQPARVTKPGAGDAFEAPAVTNGPIGEVDARGLGQNPDNLTAIDALKIQRSFRFGKNVDMILTDNRSYQSAPIDGDGLPWSRFRRHA